VLVDFITKCGGVEVEKCETHSSILNCAFIAPISCLFGCETCEESFGDVANFIRLRDLKSSFDLKFTKSAVFSLSPMTNSTCNRAVNMRTLAHTYSTLPRMLCLHMLTVVRRNGAFLTLAGTEQKSSDFLVEINQSS
jgi:hypothetical protein